MNNPATATFEAFDAVRLFRRVTPDKGWEVVRKIPLKTFQDARTAQAARELLEGGIQAFVRETTNTADWFLSIPPSGPNGFAIDLNKNDGEPYRVLFGELELEFDTLGDALTWIGRALSDAYQLRITMAGRRSREWRLEPVTPDASKPTLARGDVFLFRGLRSRIEIVVRQNTFAAS
jgi:hypothetical protein